jgi:hypothetical protein
MKKHKEGQSVGFSCGLTDIKEVEIREVYELVFSYQISDLKSPESVKLTPYHFRYTSFIISCLRVKVSIHSYLILVVERI